MFYYHYSFLDLPYPTNVFITSLSPITANNDYDSTYYVFNNINDSISKANVNHTNIINQCNQIKQIGIMLILFIFILLLLKHFDLFDTIQSIILYPFHKK